MHYSIRLTFILSFLLLLSACSNGPRVPSIFPGVFKVDTQQGNIVDQEMIDQLKPGMTRSQVLFVLGTPLIADTFDKDRWDYFYKYRTGKGREFEQTFSVFFENDVLARFEGNLKPNEEDSGL